MTRCFPYGWSQKIMRGFREEKHAGGNIDIIYTIILYMFVGCCKTTIVKLLKSYIYSVSRSFRFYTLSTILHFCGHFFSENFIQLLFKVGNNIFPPIVSIFLLYY